MLNGNKFYELPTYLTQNELNKVCAYLQGAVYVWCCIKKTEEFAAKNFVGGTNYHWEGTPLYKIYQYYESNGTKNPESEAAKDVGIILKKVLIEDKRTFEQIENPNEKRKYYKWDGNTNNEF